MKKKVSSYVTSRYILIALTAICLIFISTSFFTDKLVAPLRDAVSMVVVPLQKRLPSLLKNVFQWLLFRYRKV